MSLLRSAGSGGSSGAIAKLFDTLLGADAASIDFQPIPSSYSHLRLVCSGHTDRAGTFDSFALQFNGDAGANYSGEHFGATAAGPLNVSEQIGLTELEQGDIPAAASIAGDFSATVITIVDYASTVKNKICKTEDAFRLNGSPGPSPNGIAIENWFGTWSSLAAIVRVTLIPGAGTVFKAGTRATMYGLT